MPFLTESCSEEAAHMAVRSLIDLGVSDDLSCSLCPCVCVCVLNVPELSLCLGKFSAQSDSPISSYFNHSLESGPNTEIIANNQSAAMRFFYSFLELPAQRAQEFNQILL